MRNLAIGLIVTLFFGSAVHAATSDGEYAVKDAGLANCKAFGEAHDAKSPELRLYAGWVAGYISAHNRYVDDTLDVAPWQSTELLVVLLNNYCKKNPDQHFGVAVHLLLQSLSKQKLGSSSEKIQVSADDKSIVLYKAVFIRVQEVLAEQGFYKGRIDGIPGPSSRKAIEAFQKAKGLVVTGLPDQPTLLNLLGI